MSPIILSLCRTNHGRLSARNVRFEAYEITIGSIKELASQVSKHAPDMLSNREIAMCRLVYQKIVFVSSSETIVAIINLI